MKSQHYQNIAIIVAAGSGTRFQRTANMDCNQHNDQENIPKQYAILDNAPILLHTIKRFYQNYQINAIQVVVQRDHLAYYNDVIKQLEQQLSNKQDLRFDINDKILPAIFGGSNRQKSVQSGLAAIEKFQPRNVIIHDGVRPLVKSDHIDKIIYSLNSFDAVDSILPIVDTIRFVDQEYIKTIDREKLYYVQTPQGFKYKMIHEMHSEALHQEQNYNDDIGLCLANNVRVGYINGDAQNIKITYPQDLQLAVQIMNSQNANNKYKTMIRIGAGFDIHKFSSCSDILDDNVIICGVQIPCHAGIEAHSDGDIGFHAITEAILGAIAEGNIGTHFPANDQKWTSAASSVFVQHAYDLMKKKGGIIHNIDLTIICEVPKIMPHSLKMRLNISQLLNIDVDQVSVKATTTEKMGFLGRKEGIAAYATCLIDLPLI